MYVNVNVFLKYQWKKWSGYYIIVKNKYEWTRVIYQKKERKTLENTVFMDFQKLVS